MLRVAFLLALMSLPGVLIGPALASYAQSHVWFDRLSTAERLRVQTDLLLLGHYTRFVDGEFGQGTFNAIVDYQGSAKADGVLDADELTRLRQDAERVSRLLGFETVRDGDAEVDLHLPRKILLSETPTRRGTLMFESRQNARDRHRSKALHGGEFC